MIWSASRSKALEVAALLLGFLGLRFLALTCENAGREGCPMARAAPSRTKINTK